MHSRRCGNAPRAAARPVSTPTSRSGAKIVAAEVRLDQYRSILLEEPSFNLRRAFAAVAAPDARVISSADVEVRPPVWGGGAEAAAP